MVDKDRLILEINNIQGPIKELQYYIGDRLGLALQPSSKWSLMLTCEITIALYNSADDGPDEKLQVAT